MLTREQIEALPDDPDEMEAVLKAMSPPGANDAHRRLHGRQAPPKSQIRSIRLPRMDQFAAQNHGGMHGMMYIDIMTQPGQRAAARRRSTFAFRDDALNARNPFTPVKGTESMQAGHVLAVAARSMPNKSSFSFTAQQRAAVRLRTTSWPQLPGGREARPIGQPSDRLEPQRPFRSGDRPRIGCCARCFKRNVSSTATTSASAATT